jgi:hypothetical protein
MLAELLTRIAGLTSTGIQALRGDKTGALIIADGHARYQEAVIQGNCYTLATAAAGVTIAAANVFSAANAQPLVGVFNPQGSGVNAVMTLARHVWNSGTPAAGGLVWATASAPAGVTAANNTNPTNMLTQRAAGSKVQGYVNSALTAITGNAIVWYSGGPTTGALAANANQAFFDEVAGLVIVPPGAAGGLFAAAAGTNPIVNACIFWEEVPV